MMEKTKFQKAAVLSYAVVAVLFIVFFVYMGIFENVSIENTRSSDTYYVVNNCSANEIQDPSAPIGIRTEYSWTMNPIDTNESALVFYLVHQYAEVYFGDELVYRLEPLDTNRIGESISSNWITVPLYAQDNGKEIRVIVTPIYENVRERSVEFKIGPLHTLYFSQLKHDLPQLILSGACIILGILIILVQLILIFRRKSQNWSIFFLGNFTMLLGIWKITDTRFSPFMFSKNTMVLGYLCIGALYLACIALALYLYGRFSDFKRTPMLIAVMIISCTALIVLFCQVFGIAEFRETLPLAHTIIILLAILVIAALIARKLHAGHTRERFFRGFPMLLVLGAIADLISYYINKSSSGLVFTLFAVLIYTLSLFIISILDTNKIAYTDMHTGLFNRSRWDMLMNNSYLNSKFIGILIFDFNGLKYINDTMGHQAGDRAIFTFANILRNTIPPSNTICRWGGDEFAVLLTNATPETVEHYLTEIQNATASYNHSGETPALHYAAGYALASDFPELTLKELFQKADEQMYLNKQQWYSQNSISSIFPQSNSSEKTKS